MLGKLLGVGGMGEVWSAVHTGQDVRVAVKVITAARARDPRYQEAFRNEVRAVAGLNHPGIMHVFDYGKIDEAAAERSLGRLVAGSPYLAMELAEGGSLRTRPVPQTWTALRATLMALLDVLAHAHARGVIHRDVKPANVLVFGPPQPAEVPDAAQLRLTDFGLAHATDRGERAMRGTSGTPTYMAPEQFLGQWRDFGPWTDLYAVGCMAYAFASGSPPFKAGGMAGLRQAHLSADPAPLSSQIAVPDGFEGWILRMMDKDVRVRFQAAADAAHGLTLLGEPSRRAAVERLPGDAVELLPSRFTLDTAWGEGSPTALTDPGSALPNDDEAMDAPGTVEDLARGTGHLARRHRPPLPASWRTEALPHRSMRLVGAGLGLYGLRAIPLIGRGPERDHLWECLTATVTSGAPHLVAVRGAAGTGKTRLAQWLAERASELGNAVVVSAAHSEGGGAHDGLAYLITRALGCLGLTRDDMLRRAELWLRHRHVHDPQEWLGLVEMVWPSVVDPDAPTEEGAPHLATPSERYALVHRLLGYLARGLDDVRNGQRQLRPVVLVLDDLQWGQDALGFARFLMEYVGDGPPVLAIATIREEALDALGAEADELERLLTHTRASVIRLARLSPRDTKSLVRELLGLDSALARQVEERTAGNPLFAVQLVRDWVHRGVLRVGGGGFVLRDGERAVVPDDIHTLWRGRILRLEEALGAEIRAPLAIAALLGAHVDEAEWRGACSVAHAPILQNLVPALEERHLATANASGWRFAHGMLRESLARDARDQGTAAALHDACATTLQIRFAVARQPGLAERLARHLSEAGRHEEALLPLRAGALERRAQSAYSDALRLLEQRARVLTMAGVGPTDQRWAVQWIDHADALLGAGLLADADASAVRAIRLSASAPWPDLIAAGERLRATVAIKRGQLTQAAKHLQEASRAAAVAGAPRTIARCQLLLADLASARGDAVSAERHATAALRRFSSLRDLRGQADALVAKASAHRTLRDLTKTERYARQAVALYDRMGARFGLATCENLLGEVLRARGDLEGATEAYALAESLLRRLGSSDYTVPHINRALVLIERGAFATAEPLVEDALRDAIQQGRDGLTGALHSLLLPCVAHRRDWAAWRKHTQAAQAVLGRTGFADGDVARAAAHGAEIAASQGYATQAVIAYRLALAQWTALQDADGIETVSRAIDRLSNPASARE